jgi:hypothetical protein
VLMRSYMCAVRLCAHAVMHVRRAAVQCVSVLTAAGYLLAPADMRDSRVKDLMQDWINKNPGHGLPGG